MVDSDLTPSASYDAKDLVGTWMVVSVVAERDGREFDSYGPNVKGMLVLDANGRYSIIFIAAGFPSFGSDIRSRVTADEAMTVVAGSLAHFGTYVVDEADKSLTLQIERATFPNWDGKSKRRSYVIRGDELRFMEQHSSTGGPATTIFERAKPLP